MKSTFRHPLRLFIGTRALPTCLAILALVQCGEPSQPTEFSSFGPGRRALRAAASRGPFAYVANSSDGTVSVIDLATNLVSGSPIAVGWGPRFIAITPDGESAYVTNVFDNTVSVIDLSTNTVVGPPIAVGIFPQGVAITPDGSRAYVASSEYVSVIDVTTEAVVGAPIAVSGDRLAITPDGTRAYVTNFFTDDVSVIDLATNTSTTIEIGAASYDVAITPDGARAYLTNLGGFGISVVDLVTNTILGPPIPMGEAWGLAITPDGTRAYVAAYNVGVSAIDLTRNAAVGSPIGVGPNPVGVAITSDGARAYVTNNGTNTVAVIDLSTNRVIGAPIVVGNQPWGIAITSGLTMTPTEQIDILRMEVADLMAAGSLNRSQARELTATLDQALAQLLPGHTRDAKRQLTTFLKHVGHLIGEGVLTAAQGQPLLDGGHAVLFLLQR